MGFRLCFTAPQTTVVHVRDLHTTASFNQRICEGLELICATLGQPYRMVCCTRKLNLPVWVPRTSASVREKYEDLLEVRTCLDSMST